MRMIPNTLGLYLQKGNYHLNDLRNGFCRASNISSIYVSRRNSKYFFSDKKLFSTFTLFFQWFIVIRIHKISVATLGTFVDKFSFFEFLDKNHAAWPRKCF